MPESVTIKFRYSVEEYAKAVRLHHAARTNLSLDLVVWVLVLIFGCWMVWDNEYPWAGYVSLAVGVFWGAMTAFVFFAAPRLAFRSNPKFAEEYELTFTPEHIHFHTPSVDSRLKWSHYSRALVNADFFLLYYGEHFFTTLPKRVFADSEALQVFESLLARFVLNIKRRA
jgi:hypothetical protein